MKNKFGVLPKSYYFISINLSSVSWFNDNGLTIMNICMEMTKSDENQIFYYWIIGYLISISILYYRIKIMTEAQSQSVPSFLVKLS